MSYLPLGNHERLQSLDYSDSECHHVLDAATLEKVKATPNRWISVHDEDGKFCVVRWLRPSLLSPLQKSQYEERKNSGWFSTETR